METSIDKINRLLDNIGLAKSAINSLDQIIDANKMEIEKLGISREKDLAEIYRNLFGYYPSQLATWG